MKPIFLTFCTLFIFSVAFCQKKQEKLIVPKKIWVFILAGQSNMAGRGKLGAEDTVSNPRVLSINADGKIIPATEPLHFYEPKMKGVGCGLSFGKELLKHIPKDVSVLLIPTAVGGSSINQWIKNSTFRGVTLLSNFKEKVEIGKRYGEVKALLWHQGETDAKPEGIKIHQERLGQLFKEFREIVGNPSLPILMGEIGSFAKEKELFSLMNKQIEHYADTAKSVALISTSDFKDVGDKLHFDSESQREMGRRFAKEYIQKFGSQNTKKSSPRTPVVLLTFDDGEATHYSIVAPLLKKFNFDATFFVCEFPYKTREDSLKHSMTWSQIRDLHSMGFEIGNHTGHHKNVTKLTRDDIKKEISYIEAKCKEFHIPKPISFAYPGNRADSLPQVVLKEMGYKYARVGGSKLYDPSTDNPLLIPSYTVTSSENLKERVWKVLKELKDGDFLIFTIHGVPDTAHPDYSTTPELLSEYLEYMKSHKFKVIAMRDLEKYIQR